MAMAADPYRRKSRARSLNRPRTSPKKDVSLPFLENANEQVFVDFVSLTLKPLYRLLFKFSS